MPQIEEKIWKRMVCDGLMVISWNGKKMFFPSLNPLYCVNFGSLN
ncbi:hypothetical protein LX77_01721 [Gelidibacter algens]|jgi:hypothetical protein|uniref:Uncharacterized protein n=1 Tax=Gelidibacter algens TaxID=49280 RepID=A0A327S7R5_9FLAO|nr:hypothetical protein LX77_01721 [Gelidibacter algens]